MGPTFAPLDSVIALIWDCGCVNEKFDNLGDMLTSFLAKS